MKRFEIRAPSTLDRMKPVECDRPTPADDELLVRVAATSLNFHDYNIAIGLTPVADGRVPMSDGVGEVVAIGSDVKSFRVGDRVMGLFFPAWLDGPPTMEKVSSMGGDHVDGFASEYVSMPAHVFTKVPSHLNDVEAATLPCAGLTAWRALIVEGGLKPSDTVLVQGTGGVSLMALQLAKMAGANVIALSSSEHKLERLKQLGASHVINYRVESDWGRVVKDLTDGRGVDHVIEVVGGDLTQSIAATTCGGNIHIIGSLSRQPLQYYAKALSWINARVIGITVGSRSHQEDMVRAIESSGMKPIVDKVFPFDQLGEAFRYQASGKQFGKICVTC